MTLNRRTFLRTATGSTLALGLFPPAIQKALAIQANNTTGTLKDVEHIVLLMQENRSFDHYFGALNGVRGFADPFAIPVADAGAIQRRTIWSQPNAVAGAVPAVVAPFHLNTVQNFDVMRVEGTPHSWGDAQYAWDQGRMSTWTTYKKNHAMGYYTQDDLPFQYALANAFTLCDAYHCSSQTGTNTNRLFAWTGTNDGLALGNGPATYNDYDWFDANPGNDGGYTWTTYPERLERAGITWQVYENMDDNFTDNCLAGFHAFRDAYYQRPGYSEALRQRGVGTRDLDKLKEDVLAGTLPQVTFIVATAEGSEHPGPSSPAQGADYTAKVLDALTANPGVWSKTVLFLNFDENDGFFDHVPPPAPPSFTNWDADPAKAVLAGASTVDTAAEYHEHLKAYHTAAYEPLLLHRPYGLGPRVPMYVISPWSKGGWVNSQVFDHTSPLQFIEQRFGVKEPNISPWRRAVCGDMTSAFNFADPNNAEFFKNLPATTALADRARALPKRTVPALPGQAEMPVQAKGTRPSRALPYELHVSAVCAPASQQITLIFSNTGRAAAVFHVYDRLHLDAVPRRYTVEAGKQLRGSWALAADQGVYDLWVLGPAGLHRHFTGNARTLATAGQPNPEIQVCYDVANSDLVLKLHNTGATSCTFSVRANAYFDATLQSVTVAPGGEQSLAWALKESGNWYDFSVGVPTLPGYSRRFAGRLETGAHLVSDPAMFGPAVGDQPAITR
ncbi:phosphocholine-specific phospholipase C [Rhizobacter sp. OV335]|uniref:phosphocholine-specific phospholipase C n=1 Tax=Rhizobacter sp. OV335 TaxID=1500264 RepID=UPI00091E9540|nr:phospholipase C, phosphocholine-specific [Rhizobacter sp. OV335]SHN09861.1 phospholipase C [Rhizobacter sp. OV335]